MKEEYTRHGYDNYAGKVSYYQIALSNAVDTFNIEEIKIYTRKLEYFLGRQAQGAEWQPDGYCS